MSKARKALEVAGIVIENGEAGIPTKDAAADILGMYIISIIFF